MRLIRQLTPTGKVRVLMTSLLDAEHYPGSAHRTATNRRWDATRKTWYVEAGTELTPFRA